MILSLFHNDTSAINISEVLNFGFKFRYWFARFSIPSKLIPDQGFSKINGISSVIC